MTFDPAGGFKSLLKMVFSALSIKGYKDRDSHPVLNDDPLCLHCLMGPCVVDLPPDFLRGAADPDIGNIHNRYALYRKFWPLLRDLRLWNHPTYLARKAAKTHPDDPREVMPECVVKVNNNILKLNKTILILSHRRYVGVFRTPLVLLTRISRHPCTSWRSRLIPLLSLAINFTLVTPISFTQPQFIISPFLPSILLPINSSSVHFSSSFHFDYVHAD